MAMTLSEIVVRHHMQSKTDKQQVSSNMKNLHFLVDTPNHYESSEDAQKIVEMNIIDILYDNQISNLVYMRDITNYVKQTPEADDDEAVDVEQVTSSLLKSPNAYIKALTDKVNNEIDVFQN